MSSDPCPFVFICFLLFYTSVNLLIFFYIRLQGKAQSFRGLVRAEVVSLGDLEAEAWFEGMVGVELEVERSKSLQQVWFETKVAQGTCGSLM